MISLALDSEVTLRTLQPEDAEALYAAINNNRQHLTPWLNWVHLTTQPGHSLKFIQDSLHEANMQQSLALGIFHNDRIIGGIGMQNWDHKVRRADIGYWIDRNHAGSGIVTRSVQRLIEFLFTSTDLNKIEIRFSARNTKSAKVAERLGFRIEGVIRQATVRNGLIEDMVITGMLRSEYRAK